MGTAGCQLRSIQPGRSAAVAGKAVEGIVERDNAGERVVGVRDNRQTRARAQMTRGVHINGCARWDGIVKYPGHEGIGLGSLRAYPNGGIIQRLPKVRNVNVVRAGGKVLSREGAQRGCSCRC